MAGLTNGAVEILEKPWSANTGTSSKNSIHGCIARQTLGAFSAVTSKTGCIADLANLIGPIIEKGRYALAPATKQLPIGEQRARSAER